MKGNFTHDSGVEHPIITENIIKHMIPNEQEDIRYMKKLDDYNSEYISLKRTVKRLEKYVKFLESELDILDECVDRETVADLIIHEIVPSLINEKSKESAYSSESSEESDSGEIVEESHGYQVREKKAVPHALAPLAKQRRRVRPRKVKRFVV